MLIELTEERQKEIISEYHKFKSHLEMENQLIDAQRQLNKLEWEKRKNNLPIKTSRSTKTCFICNRTIPPQTPRRVAKKFVNCKGEWVIRQIHYCNYCRSINGENP